jgi:hypothetical protein
MRKNVDEELIFEAMYPPGLIDLSQRRRFSIISAAVQLFGLKHLVQLISFLLID